MKSMNNSDYIEYQNRVQRQAKRIAELEAENKKLEAEIEMDAKKRRIMVNGYNKKCEQVESAEKELKIYKAIFSEDIHKKTLECALKILKRPNDAIREFFDPSQARQAYRIRKHLVEAGLVQKLKVGRHRHITMEEAYNDIKKDFEQ